LPISDVLTGVLLAPLGDHVGHLGHTGAKDERQAGVLDRLLVGGRDHAGVRHDSDVGQLVGFHERLDRRQHRGRLGLVAPVFHRQLQNGFG
jgi:hypothetical protein